MMRSDHIFREAGFTLGFIQFADSCLRSALTIAFPGASLNTIEVLDRNKKKLEKATLGNLIRTLSDRVELHPDFESTLKSYCEDRNAFVHDWDRIDGWEDNKRAEDFMTSLQKKSAWLVSIFTEIIRQWCEQTDVAPEAMKEATEAGIFDVIDSPWLDNLDLMFAHVKASEPNPPKKS